MSQTGGFMPTSEVATQIAASGDMGIDPASFPNQPTLLVPPSLGDEQVLPVEPLAPGEEIPTEEVVPGAPGEEAPAEEEPEELDADTVQLPDGSTISLERLRQLSEMDVAFSQNPAIQQRVREALGNGPALQPNPVFQQPQQAPAPAFQPAPAGQQVQLPPDVDPDDPIVRYVAQQNQQITAQTAQLQQMLVAQQQQQVASGITAAKSEINKRYPSLNFDEINQVEQKAAQLGIFPAMIAQYGDYSKAAFETLDVAANMMPELRGRLSSTPAGTKPARSRADGQRQQKLNAIAGTSGTAPRVEAEPSPQNMTRQQRLDAMAREIAAAQSGQNV